MKTMRLILALLVPVAIVLFAGCAPVCDTAPSKEEPTECGGMCNPARCPDGYYFNGRPNCACVPKPKERQRKTQGSGGDGGAGGSEP